MDTVVRLLLRVVLVPLGYLAAVVAGALVILIGSWKFGEMFLSAHPDGAAYAVLGVAVAGPVLVGLLLALMWLPASVGILISEAFAIRSWIFHAINGAVSAWLGSELLAAMMKETEPVNEPRYIIAAGLAGGFAYWAVAGWNAGFWRPVFAQPAPLLPPPADPFSPPAQPRA